MSLRRLLWFVLIVSQFSPCIFGQVASQVCPRAAAGSKVPEPEDLRSKDGVLAVDLVYRSFVDPGGQTRYCYIYAKDESRIWWTCAFANDYPGHHELEIGVGS